MQSKAPKGTRDILPDKIHIWHRLEREIRDICRVFGYAEIRIPLFEFTEVFVHGVGDTTDIVQKEMYTFADKAGRSLTLRPELTAGVARAYVENGMASLPSPQKMYYLGPAYRYENVERGRYREFWQFGCEAFGAAGPQCDAELISLLVALFGKLGMDKTDLRINSIGCNLCRPAYLEILKKYLGPKVGSLCKDCRERLGKNALRVIDCKQEVCKTVTAGAPTQLDCACDGCKEHFSQLCGELKDLGISYNIDKTIVRGLDYYTRTVFEFVSENFQTLGSAILGGGRYDGLISLYGGRPTPGVGFAVGIERLLMELEGNPFTASEPAGPDIYVIASGGRAGPAVSKLVYNLRESGFCAEKDLLDRSVKAQMKCADRLNAKYAVIIGDDELDSGVADLRGMADGVKSRVPIDGIAGFISKI